MHIKWGLLLKSKSFIDSELKYELLIKRIEELKNLLAVKEVKLQVKVVIQY